jgi:hypothetical protein
MICAASSIEVSGGCHPLADARLRGSGALGDGAQQVALGDDSHDAHHVLDDDHRTDVGVVHLLGGLADRVRRLDGEDVLRHQVFDRRHGPGV